MLAQVWPRQLSPDILSTCSKNPQTKTFSPDPLPNRFFASTRLPLSIYQDTSSRNTPLSQNIPNAICLTQPISVFQRQLQPPSGPAVRRRSAVRQVPALVRQQEAPVHQLVSVAGPLEQLCRPGAAGPALDLRPRRAEQVVSRHVPLLRQDPLTVCLCLHNPDAGDVSQAADGRQFSESYRAP